MTEEKYVMEEFDEIMLEIMQNYEYDYEKIAKDIFKGKIDFYYYGEEDTSSRYYCELDEYLYDKRNEFNDNDDDEYYEDEDSIAYTTIKYEKGILIFDEYEINNIDDIVEIFNIFVKCLTKHGEYLKNYLQKRSEFEKKLGFLDEDEEDTNVDENKTDDLIRLEF